MYREIEDILKKSNLDKYVSKEWLGLTDTNRNCAYVEFDLNKVDRSDLIKFQLELIKHGYLVEENEDIFCIRRGKLC